ncbi:MAG: hypothetical protein ACI3Y0_05465 [Prevotella sp.]
MNDFDFNSVGKRLPYKVEDGFFERFEEQVAAKVSCEDEVGKKRKASGWLRDGFGMTLRIALTTAAILLVGMVVWRNLYSTDTADFNSVETAFAHLSEEDQQYLLDTYEEDIFINNYSNETDNE